MEKSTKLQTNYKTTTKTTENTYNKTKTNSTNIKA